MTSRVVAGKKVFRQNCLNCWKIFGFSKKNKAFFCNGKHMFLVEGKFDSSLCLPAILVFHFRRDHFGFHYDLKAGKSLGTAFVVLRVSVFSFSEACFRSFEPSYRVFWPETEIGEFLRESNLKGSTSVQNSVFCVFPLYTGYL